MIKTFSEKIIPYHCKVHKIVAIVKNLAFISGTPDQTFKIDVLVNGSSILAEPISLTIADPSALEIADYVLLPKDKVTVMYTVDDDATWVNINVRVICGKRP